MGEGLGVRVKPALRYSFVGQVFNLPRLARKLKPHRGCASYKLAQHFPLSLLMGEGLGVRVKPALRYSFVGQDFILPACASYKLAPHFPLSLLWERGWG